MTDDPRYEVDDEVMKEKLRRIATLVDHAVNESNEASGKKMGFGLFLFDFGPGGAMFWMSNADRQDMSRLLREFLSREGWQ